MVAGYVRNGWPEWTGIRSKVVSSVFSLVGRLPPRSSAGAMLPPLFGPFAGTTQPSDSR
jgi:hypothetical protein